MDLLFIYHVLHTNWLNNQPLKSDTAPAVHSVTWRSLPLGSLEFGVEVSHAQAAFTLPRTGLQHGLSLDGATFIFDNRHTGRHVTSVCNIECCKFLSCVKKIIQFTVQ